MTEPDEPRGRGDDPEEWQLDDWDENDLVRALLAPGTPAELRQEKDYVAAFGALGQPGSSLVPLSQRALRRIGTGGTAVVVAVALGSGVAAAYSGKLPESVQGFAHTVIGAPAPKARSAPPDVPVAPPTEPAKSTSEPPEPTEPTPTPPATPDGLPSARPSGQSNAQAPASAQEPTPPASAAASTAPTATPAPSASPAEAGSGGASAGPSATPAAPPASASIGAASHIAPLGTSVTLAGRLTTAAGDPVADHPVVLQVRRSGRWSAVFRTITDASGAATAISAPVVGLERYRWHAEPRVHSDPWRLKVAATVTAAAAAGDRTTTVSVAAVGTAPGDVVRLIRRDRGTRTVVGRAQLSAQGMASFTFRTRPSRRVFVVRVLRTPDHTAARTRVEVLPPPARPAGDQPNDQPSDQQPSDQPSDQQPSEQP